MAKNRVSNSNCSEGQRTHKVTEGPHYVADATVAVPFYILFLANGIVRYRQIISSRLCVRLNKTVVPNRWVGTPKWVAEEWLWGREQQPQ